MPRQVVAVMGLIGYVGLTFSLHVSVLAIAAGSPLGSLWCGLWCGFWWTWLRLATRDPDGSR
jgi:hypothetical protein